MLGGERADMAFQTTGNLLRHVPARGPFPASDRSDPGVSKERLDTYRSLRGGLVSLDASMRQSSPLECMAWVMNVGVKPVGFVIAP